MRIFIISIENSDSPRLTKFLSQPFFQKGEQPFTKVGIRGGDLTAKEYFEMGVKGRSKPLSPSEIGCTLSHLKALQEFLKGEEEYALILEDDAILPDHFCVQTLEDNLKKIQLSPQFLFSIGGIQMKECRKVRGNTKSFKLLNTPVLEVNSDFYHRICYTVSYIVDRSMAKVLIEYHKIMRAADDWRYIPDMYPESKIYMTFVVDHPILESHVIDPNFSTIDTERSKSRDVPISKYGSFLRYNIAKFFNKKYPLQ